MEIILGKTAGFCAGVENAVSKTEKILKKANGKIYCLGELVHNENLVKKLENNGLKIIDKLEEAQKSVIFRAHGVKRELYEKAKELKIEINDFTCPKVLKIHKIAEEYSKKGYHIFLIGKENHPEVIGTRSFCGDNANIIESIEDVENAVNNLKTDKLLIIEQTTYNIKKFENILEKIKMLVKKGTKIKVEKTICKATELRQKETENISKMVDMMIIIGGKNSSNTNKLYEISKENCKNVIFAQTKDELNLQEVKKLDKIGIMAGASTPKYIINEIIEALK